MKTTNYRLFLIFALLFLLSFSTFAQVKKYKWSSEMCEYEGTYNASKLSLAKIKATEKLAFGGYRIEFDATAWKYSDIENFDLNKLENEYRTKTNEIKNLDIVNLPYWQNLRKSRLREMEQVYNLSKVTVEGYTNPQVLKDFNFAPSCTKKFADALINGEDSLLKVWETINKESRKSNSDPERLRREFEQQLNSPDKYKFALVEVMTFGWWNCNNNFIQYSSSGDYETEKEFKKLFTRTRTIVCEEP